MGELVIYENDMNKLKFGNFTKVSMNFFMALCYFMKNKGNTHIRITFDELRKKANYKQTEKKDFLRDLDYMTDQMLKINSEIIQKKASGHKLIYKFDLFPTFIIDEEEEILEVAVNEKFTWLLNEFNHYTSIDLEEIVNFKSKYTKNIFRLIRQWKSMGELRISGALNIQEFREKIGVKKTYSNAEMNRRCLAPSVCEINDSNCSIKNLKYELEYANKRGKPLNAIIFKWDKVKGDQKTITDITKESVYFTVKEVLKERPEFTEDDILAIAKAAKLNELTEIQIQMRIKYALRQKNLLNPTGYIISLMKKFIDPTEIQRSLNKFNDFEQREYDYDELTRLLLEKSMEDIEKGYSKKEEPTEKVEKLSDIVRGGENIKMDYIVCHGESNKQYVQAEDDPRNKYKADIERMEKLFELVKSINEWD